MCSTEAGGDIMEQSNSSSGSESDNEPLHTLKFRLSEGAIPDATMIHAARKKREIARQLGGNSSSSSSRPSDYLSLNTASTNKPSSSSSSSGKTVKGTSRLVREDDFDKSDSESEEGPARSFGTRKSETTQMRVITALEERESNDEEDDEEMKLWEEEQISKGMKASTAPAAQQQQQQQQQQHLPQTNQSFVHSSLPYQYPSSYSITPASYDLPPPSSSSASSSKASRSSVPDKLLPVTMDSLRLRLQSKLSDLRETHSSNERRLELIKRDAETAHSEIGKLEQRSAVASIEYQFFQELRGYVRDLLSCLTEKVGL